MERREFLTGAAALGASLLLPNTALARRSGGKTEALGQLAKPRIDHSLSSQELSELSDLAEFTIEQASIPLHNRVSRETVRLLYGTNGEFAWHWEIAPGGMTPFVHRHVDEEEVIRLIGGRLFCLLEGQEEAAVVDARQGGKTFIIPKNTFHLPYNDGVEPALGLVGFENPEEACVLSTVYWNLVEDNEIEPERGRPNFLKLLGKTASLDGSRTHVQGIPPLMQEFARRMAALLGTSEQELMAEYHS